MRSRLCFALICCFLLGVLILPADAGDPSALTLLQTTDAEPGRDITLTLSLPDTTLAGGFVCIQYDNTLFTLKNAQLLQTNTELTLTYHDNNGKVNLLLDAAQNVQISGAFLALTFSCSEEAQPGNYAVSCTVPDPASFYVLADDGSTSPLHISGCQGYITLTAPAPPTCPARYLACQETNPSGGKVTVRLCALVDPDAALSRGSYGFVCAVTDADGTRELTLGGSEISDQIEGGGRVYTADELGGQVFTSTLSVLSTGQVSIALTPYVRLDGQTLYAGTYIVTYSDGMYVGTAY